MIISLSDIEDAFLFVNMDQMFTHNAYLCKETGQIFYTSEIGDSDELPEDIDEPEKYIEIPHKNELALGKTIVHEFTSTYLPDELEKVYSIFRHMGAYSRFKGLLERKGALEDWYKFEKERQKVALKEWCRENSIEINSGVQNP